MTRFIRRFCHHFLRLRWHSQNLNKRKDDTCGPMWRHGRAWFYPFCQTDEEAERNYKPGLCIGVSWQIPSHFYHIYLSRGGYDDDDLTFSFGCGLFTFWIHFENLVPKWAQKYWNKYSRRNLGIDFHHGAIWWELWVNDDEWSNKTPRYRQGNWCPMDCFFGREKHTERTVKEAVPVLIPMPEGYYHGTVRIFESQWKRPRWPFVKRMVRADMNVENPPMFAGKGENSWDCEDDGIFGLTCSASTPEEAVKVYIADVEKSRQRYGMPAGLEN